MYITTYALTTLTIIGGISIGILLYYHKQSTSVWVTFATCTLLVLIFCLKWQSSIWDKETHIKLKLKEPRFSEETNEISISMGNTGTFTTPISSLKKKPYTPININGFIPIKVYYLENNIYADVKGYSNSGYPSIQIKKNKLINKPPNWDFNSNEKALEVVNEEQFPVYQYIYKTSSHIIINGTFSLPNNGVLSSNELSRIFKYPSWKYPGEYDIENR